MQGVLPPELVAIIVKLVIGNNEVGIPVIDPEIVSNVIPVGSEGFIL